MEVIVHRQCMFLQKSNMQCLNIKVVMSPLLAVLLYRVTSLLATRRSSDSQSDKHSLICYPTLGRSFGLAEA